MKKGFTLIELIAVILILGIIASIAIPKVGNAINESRQRAAIVTANNYIDAVNGQILKNKLVSNDNYIDDGTYNINDLDIKMSGESPTGGKVTIESGKVKNVKLHIGAFEVSGNSNELSVSTYVTNYANQTDIYDVPFDSFDARHFDSVNLTAKLEEGAMYHVTGHVKVIVSETNQDRPENAATDIALWYNATWQNYGSFGKTYRIGLGMHEWDIDIQLPSYVTDDEAVVMSIDNSYIRGTMTVTNLKIEKVD